MNQLPSGRHITYQFQYRKCGKPSCRTCSSGKGHGPYWYAYWREGSRLRSGYVGKVHPLASILESHQANEAVPLRASFSDRLSEARTQSVAGRKKIQRGQPGRVKKDEAEVMRAEILA